MEILKLFKIICKQCKTILHYLCLVFILFQHVDVYAQQQVNNWFFGANAGLNFNSGNPVFQAGSLSTMEGSAAISDKNGNLLFYTDGRVVWDKTHNQMLNGNGLLAGPAGSSTQAALIIEHPGDENLYYLFTTMEENIFLSSSLHYNVIDIRANGGLGAVVEKNKRLMSIYGREKLTAVKHGNNKDIWVLAAPRGDNLFYRFLVTDKGINETPTRVRVGQKPELRDVRGYMKFSPDGKKLAVANTKTHVEIFDFNAWTGAITNARVIPNQYNQNGCGSYGLEFSPDSKLLYVSEIFECTKSEPKGLNIFQYDISHNAEQDILNSRFTIESSTTLTSAGALQLAPDGKIYIAYDGADHLGVISAPCIYGVGSGYTREYLTLPPGSKSSFGLPNFMTSYLGRGSIQVTTDCISLNADFELTMTTTENVHWDFDDPDSGTNNHLAGQSVSHQFSKSGIYNIKAIINGICNDTLKKTVAIGISEVPTKDTLLCLGSTLTLESQFTEGEFLWQNGSTNPTIDVVSAGNYHVTTNLAGCAVKESFTVTTISTSPLQIDTSICGNDFPATIDAGYAGTGYLWQDNSTNRALSITGAGTYAVKIETGGCSIEKIFKVRSLSYDRIDLGNDTTFCENSSGTMRFSNLSLEYTWSTGDTGPALTITAPGLYWCEAKNSNGCIGRDTIEISYIPLPVFSLGNDTALCAGATLQIDLTGLGDHYLWQDNTENKVYTITQPGVYSVAVTSQGCTSKDTLIVNEKTIPRPDLGLNASICPGDSIMLHPGTTDGLVVWNNQFVNQTYYVANAGLYSVSVTNECGTGRDEIAITLKDCDTDIIFPTAFTPNNDGLNDVFKPLRAGGVTNYKLLIFDRWGQVVFESTQVTTGWSGISSGREMPSGMYIWQVNYSSGSGNQLFSRKGTIHLLR